MWSWLSNSGVLPIRFIAARRGKRWYGFIGIGGLLGGMLGGGIVAGLLDKTTLVTVDLLLVSAAILVLVFAVNFWMGRLGLYEEQPVEGEPIIAEGDWRVLFQSRYLMLIAALLLFSQICQPIVEFQFIKSVEGHVCGCGCPHGLYIHILRGDGPCVDRCESDSHAADSPYAGRDWGAGGATARARGQFINVLVASVVDERGNYESQ